MMLSLESFYDIHMNTLLEKNHIVAGKISLVAAIIDTISIIVAVFLSLNFRHYIFVPKDCSSDLLTATIIIVVSS
jgi:hypothetical protein